MVENGIYYLDLTAKPGINFYDIAAHRITRVFDLETDPARKVAGLAVSPDKKTILYTQLDTLSSDIILVETSGKLNQSEAYGRLASAGLIHRPPSSRVVAQDLVQAGIIY